MVMPFGDPQSWTLVDRNSVVVEPVEGFLAHLHAVGLSRYDMPEYFIAMTQYPLTASGKILKRELVEWAKTGRIAPTPVRWTGG